MNRIPLQAIIIALSTLMLLGCSSRQTDVVMPDPVGGGNGLLQSDVEGSQIHLWGYYDCYIEPETTEISVIPDRQLMYTSNVVDFLNQDNSNIQIYTSAFKLVGSNYEVKLRVTLKHPMPGMPMYSGYDVRGIFIGNGSAKLSHNPDLKYAVKGTDAFMSAPCGYTRWFNPTEFTVPGMFGYTKGNYASTGFKGTATLNPFVYFADNLGISDNYNDSTLGYLIDGGSGKFSSGGSCERIYEWLYFPKNKPIQFNYAVTANWKGESPADHPNHCYESPAITAWTMGYPWYNPNDGNSGGSAQVFIYLFDWFSSQQSGVQTEDFDIYIESPIMSQPHKLTPVEMVAMYDEEFAWPYYVCSLPLDNITSGGVKDVWITVEYPGKTYKNPFNIPNLAGNDVLSSYYRTEIYVSGTAPPTPNIVMEESFDNYPSTWATYSYVYSDEWLAGGPDPDYTTNSPYYGSTPGNIRFPPSGESIGGGVVASAVSPPFTVPAEAENAWVEFHACFGGIGPYGTWGANMKSAFGSSYGFGPFNVDGSTWGGINVMPISGGDGWADYEMCSLYQGPMINQAVWSWPQGGGAFPSTLNGYFQAVILPFYYGTSMKVAFQYQTADWPNCPTSTGFALDEFKVCWY